MRAAIIEKIGDPLVITEIEDPQAGPNELVIKVKACGVCGSDLHATEKHAPMPFPKGTVMGHEFAGEVYEVGSELKGKWKVGERLTALPYISCGNCKSCIAGKREQCRQLRTTGLGDIPGGYAEYTKVGAFESIRLPDNVSYHEGASVEPLSVALHAVKKSNLQAGEDVLIIGAGPIGLALAQWCRFFGARNIIISEKAAGRLKLTEQFGVTDVIDASKESNVAGSFKKFTGSSPKVVFEAVGVPGLLQECIGLVARGGRIISVGACMKPETFMPIIATMKEVQINFVLAYNKEDFEFCVAMLNTERVVAEPMITDIIALNSLPDAFEALRTPTTQCKVIVEPFA